jgi:propanol-preferring alcohol dehydrogenase
MRAMVLENPDFIENKPLRLKQLDIPAPNNDDLLIKVAYCGVCHTDLHIAEGELKKSKLPLILGHEVIGIIEKVGKNIKEFSEGDKVGVAWIHSSCGVCKYCIRGQENLCTYARFTGYTANGGYAEYMIIPSSFAYKLPKNLNLKNSAPFMCAGVIGFRSLRLSNIQPGQHLGLFGFGASAHIVIQIAKKWNCSVSVFTRSKNHQEHARSLGANWIGSLYESPPDKIDSGIIFAPAGSVVLDALKVLDKGGTLAINAIHMTDIPSISWNLLWEERKIVSIANVTRQDAIEFLNIASSMEIKSEITEYRLEDANNALLDLKTSKFNGAAVLKI